jgi:drug/metabolite transporter (DMT)-like permease
MDPTPSTLLWAASAALFAFAFLAAFAERRRARRANLDRPGLMPWHLLQVLAFLLAVLAAALALKV